MNATQALHDAGQRLWLDTITRPMLEEAVLERYIRELAVTGLTSNPTIFDQAIRHGSTYDASLERQAGSGKRGEALFFALALEDLTRAAALFRPIHQRTGGHDGWVSLEVSPLLAYQAHPTLEQVLTLHEQARLPNLFIKIPGTAPGLRAIEEATFRGVPINVTLLFSAEQYVAAAEAYLRGIERRLEAGLSPEVDSVASVFISRWDKAVQDQVPGSLRNRLGLAVAGRTYRTYCEQRESARVRRVQAQGARLQRLLWASTGTKDPAAPDTFYVEGLVAPDTINTMPEATLLAFGHHGRVGARMPPDGGSAEEVLAELARAGVDVDALAQHLQHEGATAFVKSWEGLMGFLSRKSEGLKAAPVH
jgi:transaldolase